MQTVTGHSHIHFRLQGQQHSAQIFSLAVLLSSIFVFNQLGAIDAVAIERLAMVCELAKRIKDRAAPGGQAGPSTDQVDFHPAFIWLLRDFQLLLQAGQQEITPRQYLEEALGDVPGSGPDVDNRNQVRVGATAHSVTHCCSPCCSCCAHAWHVDVLPITVADA